jgi:hypothetical protein
MMLARQVYRRQCKKRLASHNDKMIARQGKRRARGGQEEGKRRAS